MQDETKKRLEEAINEIVTQFWMALALGIVLQSLGLDFGKGWGEYFNAAVDELTTIFSEIGDEVKSADGMKDIIEAWEIISEIGMFMENLESFLTTADTSFEDIADFKAYMEDMRGFIDDLHEITERIEESQKEEVESLIEPNDPNDE